MNKLIVTQIKSNIEYYVDCIKYSDNKSELRTNYNDVLDILESDNIDNLYRINKLNDDAMPKWFDAWLALRVKIARAIKIGETRFLETDKLIKRRFEKNDKRDDILKKVEIFSRKQYRYTNVESIHRYARKQLNMLNKKRKENMVNINTDIT